MKNRNDQPYWRFWVFSLLALGCVYIWGLTNWAQAMARLGFFVISWKWRLFLAGGVGLGLIWLGLIGLTFFWNLTPPILLRKVVRIPFVRVGSLILSVIVAVLPVLMISGWMPHAEIWNTFSARLMLLSASVLLGGIGIASVWPEQEGWTSLAASALITGTGLILLQYLPGISTYPLSLGWSEASRYYYGSLLFAKRIYGFSVPLSPLHPARYLLLAIPFAWGDLPLWIHRLWQIALWLGMSLATSMALFNRVQIQKRNWFVRVLAVTWGLLFLLQGPVYYHLLLCVIPIFLFFDLHRPWRSLVVVLLASLWAGLTRVNWFPVPGALAIFLWLLEKPLKGQSILKYAGLPLIYGVVGLAVAFVTQAFYVIISGQPMWMYHSTFTSDLLWYRLFPSPTYPVGIIRGIIWVSFPLGLLIGINTVRNFRRVSPWRWLGLAGILGVFLAGGLIVSVKIGGGSNIHNLDAFLVFLMTLGVYLAADRLAADGESLQIWRPSLIVLLIALLPAGWHIYFAHPVSRLDEKIAWQDVAVIRHWAQSVSQQGGRVLFISQRHLLTFGMIPGVPLEPDYELLVLMEMAMANNSQYLERFYRDLVNRRFDLIVIGTPNTPIKDPAKDAFAEENNVWVERVVQPLLRYYSVAQVLPSDVALMVPRTEAIGFSPLRSIGWADWVSVCGR